MKKKSITSILALVCAITCAFIFTACVGNGSMKLNEEQWDSAFAAARAWEDYTLDFRLSLHQNYVLEKDKFDSGTTVEEVYMRFTLDSTNEQGRRAYASNGVDDDDNSSYYSVENGKLFGYYYDEDDNMRKYESDGTGTAEEQFAEYVQTFDDYLPAFVFTKDGKTYQIDKLNQVLKHSGYAYEGNLGFELKLEALGGGSGDENPFKTESVPVTLHVLNTVYNAESDSYDWSSKLPENWNEWKGKIRLNLHFETEVEGEKYLVMIEMFYESNEYALYLPDTLYETRYNYDREPYEYRYDNVYGQAGPAQSD